MERPRTDSGYVLLLFPLSCLYSDWWPSSCLPCDTLICWAKIEEFFMPFMPRVNTLLWLLDVTMPSDIWHRMISLSLLMPWLINKSRLDLWDFGDLLEIPEFIRRFVPRVCQGCWYDTLGEDSYPYCERDDSQLLKLYEISSELLNFLS